MKRVALTGAGGQIAYSALFRIAEGDLFGKDVPIALHLCDIPGTEKVLEGVAMELEDCAFPLLQSVHIATDPYKGFEKIDLALLVGAKPRGPGMQRADLLSENGKIFIEQGRALNAVANRDVKVLVVGNPCNTNCLIAMSEAPDLDRKNFFAMMQLDHNRAKAQIAQKAGVPVPEVTCMTVWGNHSTTQVPDFTNCLVHGESAQKKIKDQDWLHADFMTRVQNRGAEIINARGKSSAASAAHAMIDTIRNLYTPTPKGDWFTLGICTDGNPYGIEENLIFGFPCTSKGDGRYEIVPNLQWEFFIKEKIAITQEELIAERKSVLT